MKWLARGATATILIGAFIWLADNETLLLGIGLLIAAAGMCVKSYLLATRGVEK